MKRLFAVLLILLSSPVLVAQQVDWTNAIPTGNLIQNPYINICTVNQQASTCGSAPWKEEGLGDFVKSNNGYDGIYTFSYMPGKLYQDIDLTRFNTDAFNFTFSFYLNNSCRNSIGGWCENIDGPIDDFAAKLYIYDMNGLNNTFTFTPGSTANIQCNDQQISGVCMSGYSAQNQWQSFGWYSHAMSDTLFDSIRVEFTGQDVGFWAGLYGPSIDNFSLTINYNEYIQREFLYWNRLTQENGTFTLTEPGVVRYGADGVYEYKSLDAGTYGCNNGFWGDPIGGVFKACDLGSDAIPQVNCLTDPSNIQCVLNQYTDSETVEDDMVDDMIEDIFEVEVVEGNNTENLEELWSDQSVDENTEEQEENAESINNETAVIREIANEERASILADNISVNVLELALSVAENATQTTSANETTTTQTARTASNNEATETKNEESKSDTETLLTESNNEAANELLDTGRNLNNQSLADTQTLTEQSSVDSNNLAETVAMTSFENRNADILQDTTQTTTEMETSNNQTSEIMMINNESNEISENIVLQSMVETAAETVAEEQQTETISVEETTTVVDVNVEATEQMFIVDQNVEQNNQPMDNSEMELELLQAIVASQSDQKKEDDNMTFNEDEKLTLQSDINLANAFNIAPNINNLEQAGIITNKVEEKSDAEKRAEQIVAANSKEQEEINNNYMDADQSGILGAMTVDTDVTSYRSAMLNDNSLWYKPEDIYKNKIYKDNVRGMYFLEKGNTDTYKKMVDEQYGEK
jgi:hypothetical protein